MPLLDLAAIGAIAVAVAVVLLPGLLVALLARLRGIALVALAGPLTVALVGVTGVLGDLAGVRFGWWTVGALTVVAAGLAWLLSTRLTPRSWRPPGWTRGSARDALLLVAAILMALVVFGVIAYRYIPLGAISQTYDAVFHLNATASILDTGRASSLELYRLTNPESGGCAV